MKHIISFFAFLFFVVISLSAQTIDEAKKLYKEKKYEEAAEIYYQLYMFEDAVDAYEMRIAALNKARKPAEAEALKPYLEKAQRAARMLSRCEDIQIIDSVIVDKESFLNAYFLGEEAGTLEKMKSTVVYENQLKDRRFFGKRDDSGRFRLYSQNRLGDNWTDEKILNLPVDSMGDDNYPFIMPDGLTLYYASTGNESIGGYDIFVTRYNLNNDTYLAPNQMGMPFNSIYNDYMLAIDEVNGIGYFVTDRFQPENKVVVYAFLPNEEFTSIETDDNEQLATRAKITSIRDSWKRDRNYYQSYLKRIQDAIAAERMKTKQDFTFYINDNIVYYTVEEFDSDAAKKMFLQSEDLKKKITAMEDQLESQRKEYSEGNSGKKQSLRTSILSNETRLEDLHTQHKKMLMDTRNLEIKYLRQQ